jgi:outer membrane protein
MKVCRFVGSFLPTKGGSHRGRNSYFGPRVASACRRKTSALAALLFVAATVAAQEPALRLTLDEVLARADKNGLRIAELQARVEAAAATEAGRRAADRPLVSAQAGYMRTNHVDEFAIAVPGQPARVIYPDVPDNYRTRLDLQWPIYSGGRVAALERAAGAERDAAVFDVTAARADVRLDATRAFWALVTARQTETVLARALESTDAHVRELKARLDQGLIPPNEVLTAEAERSHQRLLAIEARNLRGVAEADLRRAIGEDRTIPIEPVAAVDAPVGSPQLPASSDLLSEAVKQRVERQALASRTRAAHEREDAAGAAGRPQVAVGAGYDYARPNPRIFPRVEEWRDSWDVSVNVSWSLWDGGRRRAEEAEAAAGVRVLAARSADFDRQLAFEVEQRRLDLESAHAAIAAAGDGVTAAVEARRVVGERFTAGVATSTEVLDANTAVLQAELDRTLAIAAARLAAARLNRALGR